ncbi:MAG: hypothetical protein AB2729_12460 [Candidatus Thiodiazotropha taylori]
MQSTYDVLDFSTDGLISLLAEKSQSTKHFVGQKLHSKYFDGYFSFIGARTCIVENGYIDKDYLEDYSGYYVRCFKDYGRKCTRVHFFNNEIPKDDFDKLLNGEETTLTLGRLSDSYLGFIVVKPLPQAIIGRTCLKTYPCEDRRYFPITRDYPVSLFGIPLVAKDTLAFQEQDSVVAACATSALWSVLHGTGITFQHPIPSPVEITKAATEHLPTESRSFPNHGLTSHMMAHAIRSVGLEPFLVRAQNIDILKATIYAYLRTGNAAILGFDLYDTSVVPNEPIGMHAVAVTGYSIGLPNTTPIGPTKFHLRATRIDKIYVHDDQVGPFARMGFDGVPLNLDDGQTSASLSTSWRGRHPESEIGTGRALPILLLTPLYHKIRIPFEAVHDVILEFDNFLSSIAKEFLPYEPPIEWDIYLTTVNEFKKEIIEHQIGSGSGEYFSEFLIEPLPKFLWRAKAYNRQKCLFELVFDATDIETGPFFIRAIECNRETKTFLRAVTKAEDLKAVFQSRPIWPILEWFSKQSID